MAETAMTVREVASYLNVNKKTVYRLAQKGELPGPGLPAVRSSSRAKAMQLRRGAPTRPGIVQQPAAQVDDARSCGLTQHTNGRSCPPESPQRR